MFRPRRFVHPNTVSAFITFATHARHFLFGCSAVLRERARTAGKCERAWARWPHPPTPIGDLRSTSDHTLGCSAKHAALPGLLVRCAQSACLRPGPRPRLHFALSHGNGSGSAGDASWMDLNAKAVESDGAPQEFPRARQFPRHFTHPKNVRPIFTSQFGSSHKDLIADGCDCPLSRRCSDYRRSTDLLRARVLQWTC